MRGPEATNVASPSAPVRRQGASGDPADALRGRVATLLLQGGLLAQRCTDWALVGVFATQFMILVLQVFTRYVMNRPIGWGEEASLHLFVWMVFLGSAYGTRKRAHPRLTVMVWLEKREPKLITFQKVMSVVFLVLVGAAGAALAYSNREVATGTLGISQLFLYAAVPMGSLLMLVEMFMPETSSDSPGG